MQDNSGLNILNEHNISKLLFTIPGSDINVYLGLFSLLYSVNIYFYVQIISGIEQKLNVEKELCDLKDKKLPINLNRTLINYEKNEYLKKQLGSDIHQHYGAFYNFEYTDFMTQVDDWELNRYLFNI